MSDTAFAKRGSELSGPYTLALGGANTKTFTATGTPRIDADGYVGKALSNLGATAAATKDGVRDDNAPEVKAKGGRFAVVMTVGFTGANNAAEVKQIFSRASEPDQAGPSWPAHVPEGHVPFGGVLFHNKSSSAFTYGTGNWGAGAVGDNLRRKAFSFLGVLPSDVPWDDAALV